MHKLFALSLTITCLKDHRRLKSKHFTFGVLIAWIISLDFEIFYVYTSTSYVLSQMVQVHINKHSVSPPRKMNMVDSWTSQKIHLFAGRAVKRERRKGSSRRQQPAYGAAVNEVARELLRSVRSPKRENGGRRYIKHDGMIASPVGSCLCCWQLPLSPPVPPLYCSAPHCPSLSLRPGLMHSKMWLCELYIICYQF